MMVVLAIILLMSLRMKDMRCHGPTPRSFDAYLVKLRNLSQLNFCAYAILAASLSSFHRAISLKTCTNSKDSIQL